MLRAGRMICSSIWVCKRAPSDFESLSVYRRARNKKLPPRPDDLHLLPSGSKVPEPGHQEDWKRTKQECDDCAKLNSPLPGSGRYTGAEPGDQ
jgi:hypothetical protein